MPTGLAVPLIAGSFCCLLAACESAVNRGNPKLGESRIPTEEVVQQMRDYAEVICQISDTLNRVPDELDAAKASEQVRSLIPALADGMQNEIGAKLAGADWTRVQQQMAGQRGFEDTELSNAMTAALKGPASAGLRPVVEEIMQTAIDAVPGERTKQQLREHFRSLGL